MKAVRFVGFSGWHAGSFKTYLLFGRIWLHVNRRLAWPLISFRNLPF